MARTRLAAALLAALAAPAAPALAQDTRPQPPEPQPTDPRPIEVPGQPQQRYFLHGDPQAKAMPPQGWGLVLILPGGAGGADYRPFVGRIAQREVPAGYLTVQLVAVAGDPNLIWPTAKSLARTEKQTFTTEELAANVLAHLEQTLPQGAKLDPAKRLVMAWSSGGPAAYAMTLTPKLKLRGALVAMSVFSPQTLPPLEKAKGKAYALLQSPQDRKTGWVHVQRAHEQLTKAGAACWKRGYAGGHGWKGDSLAKLKAGLAWLAEQVEGPKQQQEQENEEG